MSDNPGDFFPDIEGEICASCEEPVDKGEAFFDEKNRCHYHPDCAGVWRCSSCGVFSEKDHKCEGCGADPE